MTGRHEPDEEPQELGHEEQPGYRAALFIVLVVACIVLAIAFSRGAAIPIHH